MPALSPTMEEGKLSKWLKKEGDKVKSGDVLAEIETDKATMEVEAVDEGTLAQILIPEGTENVKVNTPIAVLAADGETVSAAAVPAAAPAAAAPTPNTAPPPDMKSEPASQPAAAAVPAAPRVAAAADPDIPSGTEMVMTTVRDALRDAMAEEMRRDKDVFVMGEEVAEYQDA